MKILVAVFFMLLSVGLLAQTPVEIKYESEICWGDVQDSKWQPLVITYSIVTGTISTHKYNSKTGLQTWEAISCDDATKKVRR